MIKVLLSAVCLLLRAQEVGNLNNAPVRARQYVAYASEQQTIEAGKRAVLELHFRVLEGFHINSHLPKSELLIATQLALEPVDGVNPGAAEYPTGQPFSFSLDPSEKLDVYAGDFTVRLPVVAAPGSHELHGALKYQACNHAACYPPRTLPMMVMVTAQ